MIEGNGEQAVTLQEKGQKSTERTCIVTRSVFPVEELIRFVRAPDGSVIPDLKRKLPGRGVWVQARKDIVRQAVRKKLFPRAFKDEAIVPQTLEDDIEGILHRDLIQALSLANKAGCVITGFTKVESAIHGRNIAALIHASDAAQDSRRKISQALYRSLGEEISAIPVVDLLTGEELDLALGRSHVIHAALGKGTGGNGFINCWLRYRDYQDSGTGNTDTPPGIETGSTEQPPGSERNE
jgi:Predicted nucleic-acid-binding protein implicated in transcription termination